MFVYEQQDAWARWRGGVSRHKFRVPTTYNSEKFEFSLLGELTPLGGPSKIFFGENQNFSSVLGSNGHHIRYLLSKNSNIVGIWYTLIILQFCHQPKQELMFYLKQPVICAVFLSDAIHVFLFLLFLKMSSVIFT